MSGVRKAIVMRMAVDDPLAAKNCADRFADQLTGSAQAEIAATLDAGVKDELSKSEAARIMGLDPLAEDGSGAPGGSVEEQLAAIKDDDVRELTRKRIPIAHIPHQDAVTLNRVAIDRRQLRASDGRANRCRS